MHETSLLSTPGQFEPELLFYKEKFFVIIFTYLRSKMAMEFATDYETSLLSTQNQLGLILLP